MRTLLFFDDWLIQDRRGLDRRWAVAEPWPGHEPACDPLLDSSFCHPIVHRDHETGGWRMWASGSTDRSRGDENFGVFLYSSDDGIEWTPVPCDPPVDRLATPTVAHAVFSGEYSGVGSAVFRDEHEPDPARRYKVAYSEVAGAHLLDPDVNKIAVSPDGIHWTIDHDAVWRGHVTDTFYSILFNPYTGKYQFTARPIRGDRRVALYQTPDWKTFTRPDVVLHPDPDDPPCVEFYGMPQFFYEGYFVGFLWKMHGAIDDYNLSLRMKGRVDSELTYSINGTHWNRTCRGPFLPDMGLGRHDFLSEYPACLVADQEGWLRIYSRACVGEHDERMSTGEACSFLTVYRLRRDGFCALETHSERGSVTLRPLVAHSGPNTVNATVSRRGSIRAELRRVPDHTPIPGYELGNSVPLHGDGHEMPLRWKTRDTIDPFRGEPFRLVLEMDQARLYAVRVHADHLIAAVAQPNLAGDYQITHPLPLPWFTHDRKGAYPSADASETPRSD